MNSTRPHAPRVPAARLALLALAGVALVAGLDAALVRLGAVAPLESVPLGALHGMLMVHGFLGTAIALERAVALAGAGRSFTQRTWPYAAPVLAGIGSLAAIATALHPSAAALIAEAVAPDSLVPARIVPGTAWALSALALVLVYVAVLRTRQVSVAVLVQLLGAVTALGGVLVWVTHAETARAVPFSLMFLVLTIIGERLELARIALFDPKVERRVLGASLLIVLALPVTLLAPAVGFPALGVGLLALVVDTGWHDVARRTLRLEGTARFAAAAMLAGYAWAIVPAVAWIVAPVDLAGHGWDIAVHCLTIGFTMSMVVAHAPIIVPAVVRRDIPHHPVAWVPLALLHAGLLVRVLGGLREVEGVWRFGGTLGVVALLAFVGVTLTLSIRGPRPAATRAGSGS